VQSGFPVKTHGTPAILSAGLDERSYPLETGRLKNPAYAAFFEGTASRSKALTRFGS
jgi:hypothetical protein